MGNTKLHIPASAIQQLHEKELFYFKREFIADMMVWYGDMLQHLLAQPAIQTFPFPSGTDKQTGNITRGENYRGLPWVVADGPRLLQKHQVMVFRQFFWWGHYFAVTWQLSGPPLDIFWPIIQRHWQHLQAHDGFVAFEGDPWQHAVEAPVYRPIANIESPVGKPRFFKWSRVVPFSAHGDLHAITEAWCIALLQLVHKSELE